MFSRRTCLTLLAVAPATATATAIEPEPNWRGIPLRRDLYERMKVRAAENGRTVDEEMDMAVGFFVSIITQLYHYESASRSETQRFATPYQLQHFERQWQSYIDDDTYYSPNLPRDREDYSLNVSPRPSGDDAP